MYKYTDDLVEIQACKPSYAQVPGILSKIQSPLSQRVARWEAALSRHPDRLFAHYICVGLQHGFRIGFRYGQGCSRRGKANLESAHDNPGVVKD